MKREIVREYPKIVFGFTFLENRLAVNPDIIITATVTRNTVSGFIYRPEMTPPHNGKPIRRNGISLCSTVRS